MLCSSYFLRSVFLLVAASTLLGLASSKQALANTELVVANDDWIIVSLPGDPGSTGTVDSVFGDDLPIEELGETWAIFTWPAPESGGTAYVPLSANSRLYAGRAYWFIQITGSPVAVDLPASATPARSEPIRGCSSIVGCNSVELSIAPGAAVGWNLVGPSQASEVDLSLVRIVSETGACRLGCTIDEANEADIAFNNLFRHNTEAVGYETLVGNSTVAPWEGFWMAALPGASGQRVTLQIPKALPPAQTPDLADYTMVFNDEFDGPVLDSNNWNTGLLWGPYVIINQEEQLYVDTLGMHEGFARSPFSFTDEGTLKISATPTADAGPPPPIPDADAPIWRQFLEYRSPRSNEPPYVEENVNYLSGMITSYESFKFTHGFVEARVRVPSGAGLWPAFWMLPTHYVADVPEIDVMEYIGQYPNEAYHTYHYFDIADNYRAIRTPTFETIGPDFSEDFHVFSMSWDPEQIIWYVDGVEARRVDSSEYDIPNQAMYILANLAVGGTWPKSPDENTVFPAVYELDYIRAYKKKLARPVDLDQYEMVFSDEFNGTTLDPDKWSTRFIWGPFLTINNEEQHYIDSHGIDSDLAYSPFTVAGGNLTITAAQTDSQTPANSVPPVRAIDDPYWQDKPVSFFREDYVPKDYTSGIITSRESFQFTHGYAEIRAKVPEGDGLWPAFWLLNSYYVAQQPEIDIMEILGEDPSTVAHSYHWLNPVGETTSASFRAQGGSAAEGFADGFHTFGVQWMHDTIIWYVDGQETASFTDPNVSYQVMYLIANLAVGGAFNTQPVDPTKIPAEFVIDYIKVYQEKPVE